MASLPCGVLAHIFDNLGPRDLASASCVCRGWRRQVALEAAANQVWRSFYSARWQLSGAQWSLRSQHNNGSSTSSSIGAIVSSGISASRPISVPGGSRSGGSGGGGSSAACTSGSSGSSPSSSAALTPSGSPEMRWQWAYGTKMLRLRSWSGRYSADQVVGHKMAVRAVRLLPACDLMATASLDRTVRLWDLRSGLPLGHSRPHGGIVRCLALDNGLLASGCSDSLVRVWQPQPQPEAAALAAAGGGGAATMPLFHISSKPYMLRGHSGPVSCLALGESLAATETYGCGREAYGGTLFSGSWDCTVRVWRQGGDSDGSGGDDDVGGVLSDVSGGGAAAAAAGSSGDEQSLSSAAAGGSGSGGGSRRRAVEAREAEDGGWSCTGVLQYSDWVYCCAVRGGNLLVAAGSEVVVTDAASGRAVRRYQGLHDGGAVACLEGCRSGRLLFTASGDGLLLAHDLRMKQGSRVLWHHNAAVTGLAFEDPWLASSSADGCIMLQDSEQALAGGGSPQRALNANCRALHCPAGQPALCLDLADQWLAAGTESGTVRLWDFTGAAAAAERAAAARAARSAAKASRAAARQQHQHHSQNQRAQQPPPPPPPAPPLPQPLLPPQQQRHRRRRGRQQQQPEPVEPPQTQERHAPFAAEAQGSGEATDPLVAAWAAGPHGAKRVGVYWAEASPSPAESSSSSASRRSGRSGGGNGGGGGGSSDRWRHGQPQPQHPAAFQRARGPRPPPPMAPTFRYVGSGAGGGGGASGSGMATISGPGQQRPPRPQRP